MARKNKPMTVGELIKELEPFDPDLPVEMASGADGNYYHYVYGVADGQSEHTGEDCATIIPE